MGCTTKELRTFSDHQRVADLCVPPEELQIFSDHQRGADLSKPLFPNSDQKLPIFNIRADAIAVMVCRGRWCEKQAFL